MVALLVAAGACMREAKAAGRPTPPPSYVTEEVRRGNLTLSVAANGTLQPTRSVTIGSELSGTVRNCRAGRCERQGQEGQVLVELDTAKPEAQVLRSRISMAAAQAWLAQARWHPPPKRPPRNLARLQEVARLSGGKVPSATELMRRPGRWTGQGRRGQCPCIGR